MILKKISFKFKIAAIFSFIYIAICIIAFIVDLVIPSMSCMGTIGTWIFIFASLPFFWISKIFSLKIELNFFYVILLTLIFYFLVGFILGSLIDILNKLRKYF